MPVRRASGGVLRASRPFSPAHGPFHDVTCAHARPHRARAAGPALAALLIAAFLLLFLVVPVVQVIFVAFQDKTTGAFTLVNFADFFRNDLFMRSFANSVYVSAMSVVVASLLALPLAYLTMRFEFRGAVLIQSLGIIPLIMPPFIGAVAMQLLFGRKRLCQPAAARPFRLFDPPSWRG